MEASANATAVRPPAAPLTALHITVGREIVVQEYEGERLVTGLSGPCEVSARQRAIVELLANLLRDAMDLDSLENSLHDGVYKNLLKVLGQELFELLFPIGNIREHVLRLLERERLREIQLRLTLAFDSNNASASWLAGLPWEYIHTPSDDAALGKGGAFLSREAQLMLSRKIDVSARALGSDLAPIKVLLVCASPTAASKGNENGLQLVHAGPMLTTLRELEKARFIELETLVDEDPPGPGEARPDFNWIVTREAFAKKVQEVDPVLIHVIGHGRCARGRGELAFSETNGTVHWMSDEDFAEFAGAGLALKAVVLQACESALPDPYVGFSGVAQRLAGTGIPAVVAMQYRIAAPIADTFARAFYEALADDEHVDMAVKLGRDSLRRESDPNNQLSFGLPVLYLSTYKAIARRAPGAVSTRSRRLSSAAPTVGAAIEWKGACMSCDAAFSPGSSYCNDCGTRLAPYCPTCGAFLSTSLGRFCSNCGTALAIAPTSDEVDLDENNGPVVPPQAFESFGELDDTFEHDDEQSP